MRLDVLQVEPRVVVPDAVTGKLGFAAGGGIDVVILRDEPSLAQFGQVARKAAAAFDAQTVGQLRAGRSPCGKSPQDVGLHKRRLAEHLAEDRVEILEQRAVLDETHPPDVLVRRKRRIDLLQVARHAASHGQHINDLARGDAPLLPPPELHAQVERQLAQDDVTRESSAERRAFEKVFLYPCRDAAAQHENQVVMLLELVVPAILQITWEIGLVAPHP